MRFEKVCKFCYRSSDHKKNPTYTPVEPKVEKCPVCHNVWESQVICFSENGNLPIRPRPNIPSQSPTYKLCRENMSKKKCPRGPECSFAHSDAELRYWFHDRVASNPRLKPPDHVKATHFKLCHSVLEEAYGYCKYGTFCSFPHSKEELELWNSYGTSKLRKLRKNSSTANVTRPRPKQSSPPQKYILCKFYLKSNCKQGNRCYYAHSREELHAWNKELSW
jgi:hypothetical protein